MWEEEIQTHAAPSAAPIPKTGPDSRAAVPSLSNDSACSGSSPSSLSFDSISTSDIIRSGLLEEDSSGALVIPRNLALQHSIHSPARAPSPPLPRRQKIYICLFYILDCHDTFDDPEQWRTHVFSHFRMHEPPDRARCPLCPTERFTSTPDKRAWDFLLEHVEIAHFHQGQTLAGSRPDFELMRYLYNLRVISVDQFKVMQLAPPPSSPAYHWRQEPLRANVGSSDEPYCVPYSRRREARMRGQRRGVNIP
ncbi:hypothetical protein BJX61DRAFT_210481 [Aspergillus egyptiacus]|nr:hypothetical protein BJX61DRAFT_210481 [Aspergillus egyptiacus]